MKYMEYMQAHEDDSPDFCTPYANKKGTHFLLLFNGEPLSIVSPTQEAHQYDGTLTDKTMQWFAIEVNPDYDLYSGWSDAHIAIDAMQKIGCASCPWREDCELMCKEIEEE